MIFQEEDLKKEIIFHKRKLFFKKNEMIKKKKMIFQKKNDFSKKEMIFKKMETVKNISLQNIMYTHATKYNYLFSHINVLIKYLPYLLFSFSI